MLKVNYPTREDFEYFISLIRSGNYTIGRYLPPTDDNWYRVISGCVEYVQNTAHYEDATFSEVCARLLYKVAKRHELGDGNKRSSVIAVYILCLLNDYYVYKPVVLKRQAKRIAATKGRDNEELIRKRVASVLEREGIILATNT